MTLSLYSYNAGRTAEDIVKYVAKQTDLPVKYKKVSASLDADGRDQYSFLSAF